MDFTDTGDGVLVEGSGDFVEGNRIGVNIIGSGAIPNTGYGVAGVQSGTGDVIGGSSAGAGNLISGNFAGGIFISHGTNDLVTGNLIGTNAAGVAGIGNNGNNGDGILAEYGSQEHDRGGELGRKQRHRRECVKRR